MYVQMALKFNYSQDTHDQTLLCKTFLFAWKCCFLKTACSAHFLQGHMKDKVCHAKVQMWLLKA